MTDVDKLSRKLFAKAFPWLGWPEGWRVEWRSTLDCCGETRWDDRLIVVCRDRANMYGEGHLADTLIHELVHMVYGPTLLHGRGFSQRVRWAKHRAGVKWQK